MKKTAQIGLTVIFLMTIVFHVLVMLKVVPYDLVWGSRLQNDAQMYRFELVSLGLNVLFLMVVLVHSGVIKILISPKIIKGILWLMVALFLLNTLGNLASNNRLEKIIFTPITVLLSVFSFILAIKDKRKP